MQVRTAPRSYDERVDSLIAVDVWAQSTITFSFPDALSDYADYGAGGAPAANFASFSEMQKTAVREILATISAFTNLTFVEVSGANDADAVMRFANTSDADPAFAFLPSAAAPGGDVWVSNAAEFAKPQFGNFAYFTLIHEIGHALGLTHPFEPQASAPLYSEFDHMSFTVMSYNSYEDSDGLYNRPTDFAQSFMMLDIAALQEIYGANYTTNAGNTVYTFDRLTGEMFVNGRGDGQTTGTDTIFRTIWDGGGVDTIDFSTYGASRLSADLAPGGWIYIPNGAAPGLGSSALGSIANSLSIDFDPANLIENFIGSAGDDYIFGNSAANRLEGLGGRDTIYGRDGDDHLIGGDDTDYLFGGAGNDLLNGGGGFNQLHGEDGDDTILGGQWADTIDGGAGDDELRGGNGEDVLDGGDGNDVISGDLGRDTIHGRAGSDQLDGGPDDDNLYGDGGDDVIDGGAGTDLLDGGPGADLMRGGLGNDRYVVDHVGDRIVEFADGGSDTVQTPFDYVLPEHIENATLLAGPGRSLTGNSDDNTLYGNGGDNVIDGKGGVDIMAGGAGDDTYYVDNVLDDVRESRGLGIDTIYATSDVILKRAYSYRSYAGASLRDIYVGPADVEVVILTGSEDLRATGNEIANTLIGNAGNNILTGAEGNDVLDGGAGRDVAVFSDVRANYVITAVADGFLVSGPDGEDSLTDIELARFSDMVLDLSRISPKIEGTAGDDRLEGTAEFDRLFGLAGNDTLLGYAGNDLLDGGTGEDTMTGGMGDDEYYVDTPLDQVVELAGEGRDTVFTSVNLRISAEKHANIEVFVLVGDATRLIGDDRANELHANDGLASLFKGGGGIDTIYGSAFGDIILGGSGNDRMIGGAGDDFYYVDRAGDLVDENADGGIDEVRSSVDYTMHAHVENLRLFGPDGRVGIGNTLDNVMRAGQGPASLSGMEGNDTLIGSTAGDTLDGGEGDDVVSGLAGEDELQGGAGDDLLLGGDQNDVLLGQDGNDTLRGQENRDTLVGGAGDDRLYGGAQVDELFGGHGSDILSGGTGRDTLSGGTGEDLFLFDDGETGNTLASADIVTDFSRIEGDKLRLEAIDAIAGGEDDAFAFIGDAAFSGTAGELRYEQGANYTLVLGDTDGDGLADLAIRLDGVIDLTVQDFVL